MCASLAVILLAACIKEDRSACPCYLHVDLSSVDTNYIHKVDLLLSTASGAPQWTAVEKGSINDTLILKVAKDEIDFCAWGNLRQSSIMGESRTIVPDGRGDSLWNYSRHLTTRCEDMYVKVEPERQYIPVTIIIRGLLQNVTDIKPALTCVSNSLDFYGSATAASVTIVPEELKAPLQDNDYYQYSTLLLTQQSATEATLELKLKTDGRDVHASYPIGIMLQEMGEDISLGGQMPVVLDIVIGSGNIFLTLKVTDWETHASIDITY